MIRVALSGWYIRHQRRHQINRCQHLRLVCDNVSREAFSDVKQRYGVPRLLSESFTNVQPGKLPQARYADVRESEVTEPVKASMEETDIQKKLDVLALADRLGNVAEASRLNGISRDTIYRHRRLLKKGGSSALKRQEAPGLRHKNCTDISIENTVVQLSVEHPYLGQ